MPRGSFVKRRPKTYRKPYRRTYKSSTYKRRTPYARKRTASHRVSAVGLYSDRMTAYYPTCPDVYRTYVTGTCGYRAVLQPYDNDRAVTRQSIPLYQPQPGFILGDPDIAARFPQLMGIWSKSIVDKVRLSISVTPIPVDGISSPHEIVARYAFSTDFVEGNIEGFKMIANTPDTVVRTTSGSDTVRWTTTIDLTKSAEKGTRDRFTIASSRGLFNWPNTDDAQEFPFPFYTVFVRNVGIVQSRVSVEYTVDYFMTFSAPHVQSWGQSDPPPAEVHLRSVFEDPEDAPLSRTTTAQLAGMNIEPRGSPNKFKR